MDNIFSIQSLWELSVAIATRVPIQSASKPYAGNATLPMYNDAANKV